MGQDARAVFIFSVFFFARSPWLCHDLADLPSLLYFDFTFTFTFTLFSVNGDEAHMAWVPIVCKCLDVTVSTAAFQTSPVSGTNGVSTAFIRDLAVSWTWGRGLGGAADLSIRSNGPPTRSLHQPPISSTVPRARIGVQGHYVQRGPCRHVESDTYCVSVRVHACMCCERSAVSVPLNV